VSADFPFGIFKLFFYEIYDSGVGIKAYINNESLSHSINTINKSLKIPKGYSETREFDEPPW
jgi:hypothetical protein